MEIFSPPSSAIPRVLALIDVRRQNFMFNPGWVEFLSVTAALLPASYADDNETTYTVTLAVHMGAELRRLPA
jgi:hypothetical protein